MAIEKPITRKLFKMFDGKPKVLRYAFGFSPKYEQCALELAKTGTPGPMGQKMLKAAQKEKSGLKVSWGYMKVEGKNLTIEEVKKLSGVEMKMPKALKKAKLEGYLVRKGQVKGGDDGGAEGEGAAQKEAVE
ncbi:MAG: hypothetical protein AAFU49_19030 [Pseudomonadota bacterium]